ncbi:MAG: hypothetical protein NTX45_01515 [Proteobacteria bacterium]|nr:hypothetical protein [Pseudomonadota bacterium]
MTDTAILILENIWFDLDQKSNQVTVRPFFDGLSRINNDLQIYYMTFTDASSFEKSLDHLLTAPQERLFIYVASHGNGARLGNINFSNISIILSASIGEEKNKRVDGVIFGACEIGGPKNILSLEMLQEETGIPWILAYKKIMDWMPSTLIDLNILYWMLDLTGEDLRKRQQIIDYAASGLSLFNPDEMIGWSRHAYQNDDEPDISVKDAILFLVKPRGPGNIFRDDTQLLIETAYPEI